MKRDAPSPLQSFASHTILVLIGVTMLLPFLWMVSTSFKGDAEVFQHNPIPAAVGLGAEGSVVHTRDGMPIYLAISAKNLDLNAVSRESLMPEISADDRAMAAATGYIRGGPVTVRLGVPVQEGGEADRAATPDGEGLSDDLGVPVAIGNITRDAHRLEGWGGWARCRDPRVFDKFAEPVLIDADFTAPGFDAAANLEAAKQWFCQRPGQYTASGAWDRLFATRFGGRVPLMLTDAMSDAWASHSGKAEAADIGGTKLADRNPHAASQFYQYKNMSWGQPGWPVRDKTLPAVLCRASGEAVKFEPAFPIFRTEDDPLKADEHNDLMVFAHAETTPRTITGREIALTSHMRLVWANYQTVLTDPNVKMTLFAWNSLLIAVFVVALQVTTSSLAAFAFSRIEWPGRDVVFMGYLVTLMVPGAITMIPNYLILQKLGWLNTFWGLIIPGAASAYGTFMLRQYMLGLPKGLEEAARIDGAGLLRVWWDIVLPLCKPAMITLAIFTFTGTWTSFTWPLIVATDENVRVLPVALLNYSNSQSTAYPLLMAASLIMMLPMLILFVFGQKYFVRGIQLGGVKG